MIAALTVAGVLGLGLPAAAQIVKYVDERGVAHYVGCEEQIPEEYRARATEPVLPEVVWTGEHSGSLKALVEATTRLHSLRGVPGAADRDENAARARENARLQWAHAEREAARARYVSQRSFEAYQKGCRFNPGTMQDDCSGATFKNLGPTIRGSLTDRSRPLHY